MSINYEIYQGMGGVTALTHADGHLPIVEYLLERGADIEARGKVNYVIMTITRSYATWE